MSELNLAPAQIDPGAEMPHRKVIRSWLKPITQRKTVRAVLLLAFDWLVFAAATYATVAVESTWAKLLWGALAGLMIGRLFIIGHDACHQSYTPHRTLNKWLGRIAMTPSLTPYSLWQAGHNVVHHGYTNLKGVDFVWAPLTHEEYLALSPRRKKLEQIYRSGWGSCLYYLIEMWWHRMFFPNKEHMGTRRTEFFWDGVFVTVTVAIWVGGLTWAAITTGQSIALIVISGFLLPFLIWNALIGFVVYVHHTHTQVQWYNDKKVWSNSAPFVSTTVHLEFPLHFGALLHHIMEHTAHHVDMSIPLYKLKPAQKLLEDTLPQRITIQRFSWRWYFDTARQCKLYDFENNRWTDFEGHATG